MDFAVKHKQTTSVSSFQLLCWLLQDFGHFRKAFLLYILLGLKTKFMFLNFKVTVSGNHSRYLFQPGVSTSHLYYVCVEAHRSSLHSQLQGVHTMPRGMVEW